jgi:ankyrin repeat protein
MFWFAATIALFLTEPAIATELTDAVKAHDIARVVLLLKSGADPNKRSPYNGPLHDAARLGAAEITTILIRAGANIELPGFGGIHPLHSAAMAGKSEVVSILLKSGAKVDSVDNTGRTPLLAFVSGDVHDMPTLVALLEGGANPNLLDGPIAFHPLDYAAMNDSADVAEILIAFGASIDAKDNFFGETPLQLAMYAGQEVPVVQMEVAQLLINRGADVNAKDRNGFTPLDYTKRYVPNAGLLQVLLIQAGAR